LLGPPPLSPAMTAARDVTQASVPQMCRDFLFG
jgi:hypothetical protein